MQPEYSQKRRSGIIALVITVLIWAGVITLWFERQTIYDWWRLRDYDPSVQISQLADDSTMNSATRRVFYVYHPVVEERVSFNSHCNDGEFTIVLGCYVSNTGIYLYKIDDSRLSGVEQVTAAHETLHAAYDRLSTKERNKVDGWTATAYAQLDNQRIKDTIAQYRNKDPSSIPNELHSILGTEVHNLPPELENYYRRYFTDRSKIVDFSDTYEAAFSSRQAQIKLLEDKLKPLGEQIKQANKELETEGNRLQDIYSDLETERTNTEPAKYNAQVDGYNRAVRAYNLKVAKTSAMIDQYNSLYNQYKHIVLEQQDLTSAIDSRPQTLQTQ
jgi:hypothetical protein